MVQIRRPPLRGPPGCEASLCNPFSSVPCILCTLFSISRLPVLISRSLESGFRDPGLVLLSAREPTIYPQPGGFAGSGVTPGSPPKLIKFQASLQGNKNLENWSQGHPKSWEIEPGIIRNPISAKVDFCNTSLAKYLFFQSQTPKFRPKNHQKKQPGNSYDFFVFLSQKYPNNSQNGSPKSMKNR